jgi:hypothetical protein
LTNRTGHATQKNRKTDDVCVGIHGVTPTMQQVEKNAQNAGQALL